MNGLTTITTKGQVTIPESVRRALQVKIGYKVAFTKIIPSYKEAIIKIIPINAVEELAGSLNSKVKVKSPKTARTAAGKLLVKKYKVK